ncbi:glycosyltransferase [Paenibacillus sp. SI8]|uniref:MGDG synthase family glycosyltransferase n=1 Tax=unclassified Paenibacillus TaxID=185978 RepID=UPI003466229D
MKVIPRILILTAGYGNGHVQASKALQEQFESQGIQQVTTLDLMKEGHPFLNTISISLYNKSAQISRMGLDYYGWSYYWTREAEHNALINRSFNNLGRKKLIQHIQNGQPDIIVSTFPFGSAPEVCSSFGIRNYTVLTDYALHSRWIHPKVDKYYVATEELKQQIMRKGFSPDRIEVSGIPIRRQFDELRSDRRLLLEMSMKPNILIIAGDDGISPYMDHMVYALSAIGDNRVTIVCGRNEKLKIRLDAQFSSAPDLQILGYVNHLHELMSQASCVITKAGGLTLTEAIAVCTPIFIFKPYAGQEKENAIFLSQRGVALISHHVEELAAQVQRLLANPMLAEEMRNCMLALNKKRAASTIVHSIVESFGEPVPLSV